MHLTIFNGSPRGETSNTTVFFQHFLKSFLAQSGNSYEMVYLNRPAAIPANAEKFARADHVILAFPLYTDAMPAIVKTFIEALEGFDGGMKKPHLGFVIQNGFPEATHLRPLEKYLAKLALRLQCPYSGTIVKGAGEFIRVLAEPLNWMIYRRFRVLGADYGRHGFFTPRMIRAFARWNRFPGWILPLSWGIIEPIARLYWHKQLRQNNVMQARFNHPEG